MNCLRFSFLLFMFDYENMIYNEGFRVGLGLYLSGTFSAKNGNGFHGKMIFQLFRVNVSVGFIC